MPVAAMLQNLYSPLASVCNARLTLMLGLRLGEGRPAAYFAYKFHVCIFFAYFVHIFT